MARPTAILAPPRRVLATDRGAVSVLVSTRDDGNFNRDRVPPHELDSTRRRLIDLPWTLLDERHGTDVVRVESPGEHDGAVADAAVTELADAVLGVWVGDCAPVVLVADAGELGVVHAGWRGLAAGVLTDAIDAFVVPPSRAILGPVLRACCNEFGDADLREVAAAIDVGSGAVRSTTRWGADSLDLAACVGHVLRGRGVALDDLGICTGCDASYYSNRMRRESGRHVVAAVRTLA